MKLLSATLATLFALFSVTQATPTHQFDHFFPGWNDDVQKIIRENCSTEYAAYLTGKVNYALGKQSLVTPVTDCILSVFPETKKAELAVGSLIMGLIPTILQNIGSSTIETALVGIRRPLLGFLISAGSPTVSMMRTRGFAEGIAEYVEGNVSNEIGIGFLCTTRRRGLWAALISIIQYIAVGGAVANVFHLAYELGVHAIAVFARDTIFAVPLWTLGAAIIHLAGLLAIWLRVRLVYLDDDYGTRRGGPLSARIPTKILPSVFHPPMRLKQRSAEDEKIYHVLFYALTWAINIGIIAQVAFGTLTLSGLLFFSITDTLIIVARYSLSAIVCRAVVRFELAGMLVSMAPRHEDNEKRPEREQLTQDWKGVQESQMYVSS
ncbi:hypothetical protein F5Y17DRAFT_429072 [Xylariaceae sp. FL0594]|nr:hypothetical protein F5Y17DRAFT_429072 [Xylariaceae sp. FL0594]